MSRKEPAPVAILSARIMRAYPSLSAYSAASLATELCAIERAQHRHAERCCSGADGGYVRKHKVTALVGIGDSLRRDDMEHDPVAEERADHRIETTLGRWRLHLASLVASSLGHDIVAMSEHDIMATAAPLWTDREGDPRGCVLKVQFPGEHEPAGV